MSPVSGRLWKSTGVKSFHSIEVGKFMGLTTAR